MELSLGHRYLVVYWWKPASTQWKGSGEWNCAGEREREWERENEREKERVSLLRVCIRCREESEDLYDWLWQISLLSFAKREEINEIKRHLRTKISTIFWQKNLQQILEFGVVTQYWQDYKFFPWHFNAVKLRPTS